MSPKLLNQEIRKRYLKTLGTSVTAQCPLLPRVQLAYSYTLLVSYEQILFTFVSNCILNPFLKSHGSRLLWSSKSENILARTDSIIGQLCTFARKENWMLGNKILVR